MIVKDYNSFGTDIIRVYIYVYMCVHHKFLFVLNQHSSNDQG